MSEWVDVTAGCEVVDDQEVTFPESVEGAVIATGYRWRKEERDGRAVLRVEQWR